MREPGERRDDVRARGLEEVALRRQPAQQVVDLLLEPVDDREVALPGALQHLALDLVDAVLDRVDDRIERVGQAVEDPVHEVLLDVCLRGHQLVVQRVELAAGLVPGGHDEAARDVDVDLERRELALLLGRAGARGVEDEQDVVLVAVELGALVPLARVLERQRVQAEHLSQHLEVLRRRIAEVEPEEVVSPAQLGDLPAVDRGEDLHAARLAPGPDGPGAVHLQAATGSGAASASTDTGASAAGRPDVIRTQASTAATAAAAALSVSAVESASTNADWAASTARAGAPCVPAPEPRPSTRRS